MKEGKYRTILENVNIYTEPATAVVILEKGSQVTVTEVKHTADRDFGYLDDDTFIIMRFKDIISVERVSAAKKKKG